MKLTSGDVMTPPLAELKAASYALSPTRPEDIKITRKLADAGHILGIKVLDHIIIARNGFSSLKDRGIIS